MSGMCVPAFSSAQTVVWSVSLSEITSDVMSETELLELNTLLDQSRIDGVFANDGAFVVSFGAVSLYYSEDTGLLARLPDKVLNQNAGVADLIEAMLNVDGESCKWYRPTVAGMAINSSFISSQRPVLISVLGDMLGVDLSEMPGEGVAYLLSPDMDEFHQAFEYLYEDSVVIAQRMKSSLIAFLRSGPMKSLMSGLLDDNHLSLSSSSLDMLILDAQRTLSSIIDRLRSGELFAVKGHSSSIAGSEQEPAQSQDLPAIFKGLHFSDLYAHLYRSFGRDLHSIISSSGILYLLRRPVSLPWFSIDASPKRLTLAVGDSFLLTADNKSDGNDSVLWTGQVFAAGVEPGSFELQADHERAVLNMNNPEGGLVATLSYSLPDWSENGASFTLNVSIYTLERDGRLSEIQNVTGTLYIDQNSVSLQGANGRNSILANISYSETGITAKFTSAYRGWGADPVYQVEVDWKDGLNAQLTQVTQYGSRTGVNAWITPQEGAVEFGFRTIDIYGTLDAGETIINGSFAHKDDREKIYLEFDGNVLDFEWLKLGEGHRRALTSIIQSGQDILHVAMDVEVANGKELPVPNDYEDVDLTQLFNSLIASLAAINEAQAQAAVPTQGPSDEITVAKQGFAGPVAVTVVFADDNATIERVAIGDDKFAETEGFGAAALEPAFAEQFVGKKAPLTAGDFDVISGATYTSDAVLAAINEAQAQAAGEDQVVATPETSAVEAPAVEPAAAGEIVGGITVSKEGFAGPVAVTVLFADDNATIDKIAIGDDKFAETKGFGAAALEPSFAEQFVGKKAPLTAGDFDAISGATYTSDAVLSAVNEAWKMQAE